MKVIEFILISFLLIFSLTQTGCASFNRKLKNFLGGKSNTPAETTVAAKSNLTKFSETSDIAPRVRRQYKRTTKETLADESALDAKSGSLWVMEGQGAYLFSQNIVRLVGDPIAVQLDGDPKDQLNSKVTVIKKLLAKIEEKQKARLRQPSGGSEEEKEQPKKKGEKDKAEKSQETANQQKENIGEPGGVDFNVKTVPTRIVERTADGNYRVKGSQPFMVGAREYKVIVTGVVRAEDFNDEGISATKLLDPKFDIVSARRKESEM